MKISLSKPPVYEECKKAFDFGPGTIFTYADTCYNPDNWGIPDHLVVHEETHMRQQNYDQHVAAIWWKRYIEDSAFRVEQEVEAYGNQYRFICKKVKDRNARYHFLDEFSRQLSSPMYGNAIDYAEAKKRIRGYSPKKESYPHDAPKQIDK